MSFNHEVLFACKLLPLLEDPTHNPVLFSPASILTGLTKIYVGAKEETEKEIGHHVGKEKTNTKEDVIEHWSKNIKMSEERKEKSKVKVTFSNGLFVSSNLSVFDEFEQAINDKFNGGVEKMDFNDKDLLLNKINNFIAKSTDNQITEVLNNEELSTLNNLISLNTVHFIAPWDSKFEKLESKMFFSAHPREIQMMKKTVIPRIGWNLSEGKNWVSLGIPYNNFEAWFYIVLPNQHYSLLKLIESMNVESFAEWTKKGDFKGSKMFVTVPVINASSNHKLNKTLETVGLKTLFNDNCNLGGMSETSTNLDQFVHASTLKIDEEGTDATSVAEKFEIPRTGGGYKFCADRPFLYFVVTCHQDKKVENNQVLITPNNLLYVGTFC